MIIFQVNTYSSNENGGHVTTGLRHKACCFLRYSVTILSSDGSRGLLLNTLDTVAAVAIAPDEQDARPSCRIFTIFLLIYKQIYVKAFLSILR